MNNNKKDGRTKVDQLKDALEKRRQMAESKIDEQKTIDKSSEKGPASNDKESCSESLDAVSQQLTVAEEEAKVHYDKLLRVMADLDNFKKRSEREKLELSKFSNEQLITALLPVLDDLNRVLEHLPEGASKELMDFVSGVQLVKKQFMTALGKYGLEEIKVDGQKFNPEYHEAVTCVPSDDVESGYIIKGHRQGYILNGRVIRAAMVSVAK